MNPARRIIVAAHQQRLLLPSFFQRPGDKFDYEFDFAGTLETGETIAAAAFTLTPEGVATKSNESNTTSTAKLYLTSENAPHDIVVQCRVTTNAAVPRIRNARFVLRLVDK